jgi:DNA-binding PadR family transcriptional regulator
MYLLSRSEEIVLLSIWKLQEDAYGVSIRDKVIESTGYEWSIGALYAPLHRLQKKGLVESREGDPVPERGGRRKIFYRLTPRGREALLRMKKVHDVVWSDVPDLERKGT